MPRFYLKIIGKILECRIEKKEKHLYSLRNKLHSNLERQHFVSISKEEINKITESVEKFKELPIAASNSVSHQNRIYQDILYVYALAKNVIAVYEAYSNRLPLQIFNEMRNAFDHFARSVLNTHGDTEPSQRTIRHLTSVQKHIRRAFIDIAKLICGFFTESIESTHSRFSEKALGLVDNGDYVKKITQIHNEAKYLLVEARIQEFELSNKKDNRDELFDYFIKAVIQHKKAFDLHKEKIHLIRWGGIKELLFNTFNALVALLIGIGATLIAEFIIQICTNKSLVSIILDWLK